MRKYRSELDLAKDSDVEAGSSDARTPRMKPLPDQAWWSRATFENEAVCGGSVI